jgi:hypothetical protein
VGTATQGPSNIPFTLADRVNAYDVLGASPLAKAHIQASKAGATDIVLYRINGVHSTGMLSYRNEDASFTDVLKFTSVCGNDIYNSISSVGDVNNIQVSIDGVTLTVKRTDGTYRLYLLQEYRSASALADALNTDYQYGLVEFETTVLVPEFQMALFTEEASFTTIFSGGSTEEDLILNRSLEIDTEVVEELKGRIITALFGENENDRDTREPNTILGLLDYAAITLADFYYEDDPEMAVVLGEFCQKKSAYSGHGAISAIGTRPLYGPTDELIAEKALNLNLLAPTTMFITPSGVGSTVETVATKTVLPLNYTQIVVGDTPTISILGGLAEPFPIVFAYLGSMVARNYYINPTNKQIAGIKTLGYEFSKEVIDNLASNGYISIVSSIRRGYVPYFAITGVGRNNLSSFKKPHYIRISQHIGRLLNESLDDIVGTTKTKTTTSDIQGRINDLMQILVDSSVIRGYSLACEFSNYNTLLTVSVTFTPFSDIEAVSSITTLPLGQGVIGS